MLNAGPRKGHLSFTYALSENRQQKAKFFPMYLYVFIFHRNLHLRTQVSNECLTLMMRHSHLLLGMYRQLSPVLQMPKDK